MYVCIYICIYLYIYIHIYIYTYIYLYIICTQDPAGPWNYKAICTAPKGIVAVLTLALVGAVVGFAMCVCCAARPLLAVVPAILDAVLAALGPIAYGAAVASSYPWKALEMDQLLQVSFNGASAATSDVATVPRPYAL